ncbi:hypothetical protein EMQ25_14665 [Arsenicitalea aurantiaca]|uniref:ImuA protein n=1 Tax=Arsenicitalea aurantiaca TaxID=1783274 RepID=A0A433X5M2_9HYPH|nr:hypothetical protein [Arsenicitalea aurantiaca]RUT29359.1 hypothetical protein EMQ25_14665 [Arsenicitalea aurantiaca]
MHGRKHAQIETLRARIAALEERLPASGEEMAPLPTSQDPLALPGGLLHEVFTDARRNGAAMLGFALGLARPLLGPGRPALVFVQMAGEAQEAGLPYGAGLAHFGVSPESLLICRVESVVELLWAIEEAALCRAVAAVIADIGRPHKALDFTASRRLSLRAADAGSTVLLLRYGTGREASAARFRWRLSPAPSAGMAFDARAPGRPRWRVDIEKGRLGKGAGSPGFFLDWTEHGFAILDRAEPGAAGVAGAPSSGAASAGLGNRYSEAG